MLIETSPEYETFNVRRQALHYFMKKLIEMKCTKKVMSSVTGSTLNAVESPLSVSLRLAKCGKAHTTDEEILLLVIVTYMLSEESANQLHTIPLPNYTERRMTEITTLDVKENVIV